MRPLLKPLLVSRGLPVDDDVILLWCMAMRDLSQSEVQDAILGFVQNSTEFPTPAAVRKFAGPRGLADSERAKLAWGQVRTAIRQHGGYQSVDFEDRIVNAVIREMGGWNQLCESSVDEMVWREKDFIRLYEAVAKSGVGDASALPGLCEASNVKAGLPMPEPCRVGARLPEHVAAGALPVTERQSVPRLEQRPAVRNLIEGLRDVRDGQPETSALPKAELTPEEICERVAEQKRKLTEWENQERQFAETCREAVA